MSSVPRTSPMPVASALLEIQAPVRARLDLVPEEMWRVVRADAPIVESVNAHLTGMKGKITSLKDTIRSFKEILAGKYDDLPEQAFLMVGTIEEVIAKAERIRAGQE